HGPLPRVLRLRFGWRARNTRPGSSRADAPAGVSVQEQGPLASEKRNVREGGLLRYGTPRKPGGTVSTTKGDDGTGTGSMSGTSDAPASFVRRFRLRDLDGPLGSFESSSDRLQIGSHPSNQVQIKDRTISRFHCEVFVEPSGRAWVRDLGSRNGTRVNGTRV